jgi:phosphatidylglycerophosphate synthase
MVNPSSPSRVNDGILQPIERLLLAWLARRVPRAISPDMLTIIGVLGALLACVSYGLASWQISFLWLASFGLVANWIGDSLDGTLARARKIERPRYGFFVDQASDLASQILIGFGLALSPFIRFEVALIGLVAYLALATLTLVRRCASGLMQICYGRIGPTEIRCALVLANTYWLFNQPFIIHTLWGEMTGADAVILGGSLMAIVGFVVSASGEAKRLAVVDPEVATRELTPDNVGTRMTAIPRKPVGQLLTLPD